MVAVGERRIGKGHVALQAFPHSLSASLKQLVLQYGNSELGWSPSGDILMKNRTYKIITQKWMSRWGMFFPIAVGVHCNLGELHRAQTGCALLVGSAHVPEKKIWWQPYSWDQPLTWELWTISKYPETKIASCGCSSVVGTGGLDSSPGAPLPLEEDGREKNRAPCLPWHASASLCRD